MAAAYSAAASGGSASASTTISSGSVAVASGSVVYVFVGMSDSTYAAPSSVVWDPGVANESLTKIHDSGQLFTYGHFSVWRGVGLTAKTSTVQATWGASKGERVINVWVGTGIDTTTPNGTIGTGTASSTSVSATATTTTGQLVLGGGYVLDISGDAYSLTLGSPNGTERTESEAEPYDVVAVQDISASGSTQAITWTVTGTGTYYQGYYAVAIPLNNAGAAATSLLPPQSTLQRTPALRRF